MAQYFHCDKQDKNVKSILQ